MDRPKNISNSAIYKVHRIALILLTIASICLQGFGPSSPDKDWLLLAAKMWVNGKTLYTDIFESNPPLILWINAFPALIAPYLPPPGDVYIMKCLGFACCALSIFVSMRVIDFHPQFACDRIRKLQCALLLVFILVFDINPTYFFDREHIFMLLTFPYMLRWLPSLSRARLPLKLRIGIGVMAGIGFCIKPHCLLLFLGLQCWIMLLQRKPYILTCLENRILYGIGLLYLLLIGYSTPQYFTLILPMEMTTYAGYNMRSNQAFYLAVAFFSLAVTFVDFRLRLKTPWRKDIGFLAGLCFLGAAYALANNGWGYTFVPLFCMVLLLTAFAFWDYRWLSQHTAQDAKAARSSTFGMRACLFVFAVYAAAAFTTDYNESGYQCERDSQCKIASFLKVLSDEHAISFGTITMDFGRWTQIARSSQYAWQTRFNHLWMLPALIADPKKNEWKKYFISKALATDLNRHAPQMVFVDASPEFYTMGVPVDLVAYFSADPGFTSAFRHYAYVKSVNFCAKAQKKECRYDMYRRIY